ncbi:MAG: ferritin-like domain-containing protein [Oligoflexia bacterium]|nr:ferritin-like domain-containing protein [Oligoflexia bacterium]
MLEQRAITRKLQSLAVCHGDLIQLYEEAMNHVEQDGAREELSRFRTEHEHHFRDLSEMIRVFGGEPLEFPRGRDWQAPRMSGARPMVEALRESEAKLRGLYDEALTEWSVPEPVKGLLRRVRASEDEHERYFDRIKDQASEKMPTKKVA